MAAVILISSVAILVAIVGCIVIWRLDAARAEEIEHEHPPTDETRPELGGPHATTPPPPPASRP